MSSSAAFCFFPSKPALVLLTELENTWVKGLPDRFIYFENAQNPRENYSREVPPDPQTSAFINTALEMSGATIERMIRDLRIGNQHVTAEETLVSDEGEAPGPGWICKIGYFFSPDQDLTDFLAAAQMLLDGSKGRIIYLRDSYSLAKEVWTATLQRIEFRAIADFPPNPNSCESFQIARVTQEK